MGAPVPIVPDGVRQRLTARFGDGIEAWFAELPAVVSALADRWRLAIDAPIPRGSVSVVIRCRMADGRAGVLKVSPDRTRLAGEAAALSRWTLGHTPAVLALDARLGALLLEAIQPGTPLDVSSRYPALEGVGELLTTLHTNQLEHPAGVPHPSFPPLAERVGYLFDSSAKLYRRHPELAAVLPPTLYERGRQFATRLAHDASPVVLLHGDLTPRNLLDGGSRGLVAIDPAPCLGDAAFAAIDLLLWQADAVETIEARVAVMASATGGDAERLLAWCKAFAGMAALELGTSPETPQERVTAAVTLAAQAPTA
jgi:streptomycin 6-kinase